VFAKGGATKKPTDYTGGRTSSDIVAFVKAAVGAADDGSDAGGGVSTKLVKPLKYVDTYSFMYLLETAAPVKVIAASLPGVKMPAWPRWCARRFTTVSLSLMVCLNVDHITTVSILDNRVVCLRRRERAPLLACGR
jgi:hypothetical protein